MRPVGGSTPLKLSNDWHDFKAKLDRHYPPLSWITQLAMDLDHQRDREWIHEIKHDGLRLMVRRNGAGIRLFTSDFSAYADRPWAIPDITDENRCLANNGHPLSCSPLCP